MCKFTGIFASVVTTCDQFLCTVKNVGAEAGSAQNPTGFYKGNIMNFEQSKFNLLCYSKEVLWIDFELVQDGLGPKGQKTYDNFDWFEGDDVLRLRTAVSGMNRLERAVGPECNEIVASKRNLKNNCKNLERQPLQRLQLCRRRLDKVEIIFLRYIWWTTGKTIPRKSGILARGEAINIGKAKLMFKSTRVVQTDLPQRRA